ncbi:Probable carotenoid cleavage dioxygenase 4, chloroplastic [Linum grandiflorum]
MSHTTSFMNYRFPHQFPKPNPRPTTTRATNGGTHNFLNHLHPPPLHPSIDPRHVFTGNYAPVKELEPTDCHVVEGKLPTCLNGVYIRNGPNPPHDLNKIKGPLHFFEGDGMLHSLKMSNGRATYCSRYVETYKYSLEKKKGSPVFPNLLSGFYGLTDLVSCLGAVGKVLTGQVDLRRGYGLGNTSVGLIGNKILALCESDMPYVVDVKEDGDLQTVGRWDFDDGLFANMTAHPKVDPVTNEAFAFRCSLGNYPHLTYFRFTADGTKLPDVPIHSINQPSFIHDFFITSHYAIFPESQLQIDATQLLLAKGVPVVCNPTKTPRIGILPRYDSTDSEIRWFPIPGFNPLHVLNAWESHDGERIVLVATNVFNVMNVFHQWETARFQLEEVTLDLKTGEVCNRRALSAANLEFGAINPLFVGKRTRYAYYGLADKVPRMYGVVKIDLAAGCEVGRRVFGPGRYGGEPFFVAAGGDREEEDDGFLATYVHDEDSGESRFVVMDAKSPELDVVAAVRMPRRVPYGLHGLFVRDEQLALCNVI